jgi:hypothetical protein
METQTPDDNPSTRDVWMRGLFMFLFMIGFAIGQWLLNVLAVVQFLCCCLRASLTNSWVASAIPWRLGSPRSHAFLAAQPMTNHFHGGRGRTQACRHLQ